MLASLHVGVGLENVGQLVCQIILSSGSVVDGNRRSHGRRRHRQGGDDEPLRSGIVLVETQPLTVLGRNVLEHVKNLGRSQQTLLGRVTHVVAILATFPRAPQLETVPSNGGLDVAAASMGVLDNTAAVVLGGHVGLADHLGLTERPDGVETTLGVSNSDRLSKLLVVFVQQHLSTVETNGFTDFFDFGNESNVEHGLGELDMAEMAGAFCHAFATLG